MIVSPIDNVEKAQARKKESKLVNLMEGISSFHGRGADPENNKKDVAFQASNKTYLRGIPSDPWNANCAHKR
jgi:hypothetical protein